MTWKKILYIGDHVGAVDMAQDPRNPDILYAATYEHIRLPWMIVDGGPGTGLYKTIDGGAHWQERRNGLPEGPMGRIGASISASLIPTRLCIIDIRLARKVRLHLQLWIQF